MALIPSVPPMAARPPWPTLTKKGTSTTTLTSPSSSPSTATVTTATTTTATSTTAAAAPTAPTAPTLTLNLLLPLARWTSLNFKLTSPKPGWVCQRSHQKRGFSHFICRPAKDNVVFFNPKFYYATQAEHEGKSFWAVYGEHLFERKKTKSNTTQHKQILVDDRTQAKSGKKKQRKGGLFSKTYLRDFQKDPFAGRIATSPSILGRHFLPSSSLWPSPRPSAWKTFPPSRATTESVYPHPIIPSSLSCLSRKKIK